MKLIWALIGSVVLVVSVTKAAWQSEPMSCDYWYPNSTDGVCFVKTNGHGQRVAFTKDDRVALRKQLGVQCDTCE